jgi:D-alanyl-D-alanine carboxypeptidase
MDSILLRRFGTNLTAPGVQVALVNGQGDIVYENAVGWAANPVVDSSTGGAEPLTTNHRCNLYSVTKFFTACAILELIEQGRLRPDDELQDVIPPKFRPLLSNNNEDGNSSCTVQDLISHQSGAPNPIPLTWVHTPEEDAAFDETQHLLDILKVNSFQTREAVDAPALPYKYSNLGYWLLGHVLTHHASPKHEGCSSDSSSQFSDFSSCCQRLLHLPESISQHFDSKYPTAYGHVSRWSLLALAAILFCPRQIIGPKSWKWIRMELHCIDGVAYGGLIGSSHDVAVWLGSLLQGHVFSSSKSLEKLFQPINNQMTFGLHIRKTLSSGKTVYHKEGGGAGCHSSIQIRPDDTKVVAGCVIACDASFDVNGLLDELMDYVQEHK